MNKHNLCFDWQFHYFEEPVPRLQSPNFTNWHTVDLPHDWSIGMARDPKNICGDAGGYFPMNSGLYQKSLPLSKEWRDKKVLVEFEGVYMNAEIWLNHHFLGRHPYGYTSFHLDLTPYLDWEGTNILRVFVDNSHQPNSRWYTGSGIYRPVWLLVSDPVHVLPWGVNITTSEISSEAARVKVETRVQNESGAACNIEVRNRVYDPQGSEVGVAKSVQSLEPDDLEIAQEMQVHAPQLWSPDTPHLYRIETEVWVDDHIVDTETTIFGIRSLEFSAEKGFLLNGEPTLLKGGCVHHDNGILGAASYPRSEARKVEIHKASGFNAIRCAHNPPAPAFLEACDRLGMLVIDEAFDCWRDGKNQGDYHVVFDDWWQRDLESMIYRDRNHPCIILWSIGNEVMERDGYGNGYDISRMLAEHVRKIDPTRPVTAAICSSWRDDPWEIMAPSFATLDVSGYNYLWAQYRPDHERFPDRIMVGSESYPLEALENWQAVQSEPYVIGDFVWTSLDYLGEAGVGQVYFESEKLGGYPWHQANCGDLDLCGFKRPQSFYRDTIWQTDPRVYIAVHHPYPSGQVPKTTLWGWPNVWPDWTWPGHEGNTFKVEVYTNCEEVELFLDDGSLGRVSCSHETKNKAEFAVVYAPGYLRAIGYRAGQPVTEQTLSTVGEPVQIRLTADREILQADGFDLSFITVEVLDSNGFLHPNAENRISLTVDGPGKILAVGNGNPISEEPYYGNQLKVHRGRALVVVKSLGQAGEIHLTAEAGTLRSATSKIRSLEKTRA